MRAVLSALLQYPPDPRRPVPATAALAVLIRYWHELRKAHDPALEAAHATATPQVVAPAVAPESP